MNISVGSCELCGKLAYLRRADARVIARTHHPHKNTYRCPHNDQVWHVGSLPRPVIRGEISRQDIFLRRAA